MKVANGSSVSNGLQIPSQSTDRPSWDNHKHSGILMLFFFLILWPHKNPCFETDSLFSIPDCTFQL